MSTRQDFPLQPQRKFRCKSEVLSTATILCTAAQNLHRLHQEKEEDLRLYCCITSHSKKFKDSVGTGFTHTCPWKVQHVGRKRKDEKVLQLPLIHAQTQRKQKILCQTLLGTPSHQQSQQTISVLTTTFLHITANYNRVPSHPWNKICNILIISTQSREAVLLSSS